MLVPSRERDRHLAVTVVSLPGSLGSAPGALRRGRRPHPADAGPEGGGLGRGGAQARPRDQEPAHPDPALGPARCARPGSSRTPTSRGSLAECTRAIVDEVEALKNLVDEFAQFARLPAASLQPASLHDVIEQALSLYDGLFPGIALERRVAADLPALRLDPDQMKRVLINLVDNAIEATGREGPHPRGDRVRPGGGTGAARRGRRRARDRPRRPRPAVRPALLDQEAGQRARPRHREPHRPGAPRHDPGRGQRARAARASWWSCRREGNDA